MDKRTAVRDRRPTTSVVSASTSGWGANPHRLQPGQPARLSPERTSSVGDAAHVSQRVVVTSDLHLGITSARQISAMASTIAAADPALTVLAGDIGEGLDTFQSCLALFALLPGDKAVLAGNHDLWAHAGRSSDALWTQHLPSAAAAGMLWLEKANWAFGNVAVAGSFTWYDYSAAACPRCPPPSSLRTKRASSRTRGISPGTRPIPRWLSVWVRRRAPGWPRSNARPRQSKSWS